MKLKPLKHQVMVIAGATTPIGLATARAAGRSGARVMLIDADEATLGESVRAINNAGGVSDYVVAGRHDASALAAAGHVAKTRFGRIDSWVSIPDGNEIGHDCRVAVPLLQRGGGALIVVGTTPTIARALDPLRADVAQQAASVAVVLVKPAFPDEDPQRLADAILRGAVRPRCEVDGGNARVALGSARSYPGIIAMVGLSGLALAAGAVAAVRRARAA